VPVQERREEVDRMATDVRVVLDAQMAVVKHVDLVLGGHRLEQGTDLGKDGRLQKRR